jgi:hypothetical protein
MGDTASRRQPASARLAVPRWRDVSSSSRGSVDSNASRRPIFAPRVALFLSRQQCLPLTIINNWMAATAPNRARRPVWHAPLTFARRFHRSQELTSASECAARPRRRPVAMREQDGCRPSDSSSGSNSSSKITSPAWPVSSSSSRRPVISRPQVLRELIECSAVRASK